MKTMAPHRKTKSPQPAAPTFRLPKRLLVLAALAGVAFAATFGSAKLYQHLTATAAMVWIPGGEFTMGTDSDRGRAEEKPAHRVRVDAFWMDETDVTNAQFRTFVDATGYVTTTGPVPILACRTSGSAV